MHVMHDDAYWNGAVSHDGEQLEEHRHRHRVRRAILSYSESIYCDFLSSKPPCHAYIPADQFTLSVIR